MKEDTIQSMQRLSGVLCQAQCELDALGLTLADAQGTGDVESNSVPLMTSEPNGSADLDSGQLRHSADEEANEVAQLETAVQIARKFACKQGDILRGAWDVMNHDARTDMTKALNVAACVEDDLKILIRLVSSATDGAPESEAQRPEAELRGRRNA